MNTEKIKIKSTKGFLSAIIHHPENDSDKLAILCPGYLDTKDYPHLASLSHDLCNNGFISLRFDPTGTWESEGEIEDYNISQYLLDIESILNHMNLQKRYKTILLGGHSRGGQVSVLYAAEDPRITHVLGIMPSHYPIKPEKVEKWKTAGIKTSHLDIPGSHYSRTFDVPFSYVVDRDQYNTLSAIQKIKAPIFLIAGENDRISTPKEVYELYSHAKDLKGFVELPDMAHNYRLNNDDIRRINKTILTQPDFLSL